MKLEVVREDVVESTGAIPGKLYVDGAFFGYTLENLGSEIPEGSYTLYTRFSPKFGSNKIGIEVPGRKYLQFHGGNNPEDSAGCVIVARERVDDSRVYGDLSGTLYTMVSDAADSGEAYVVFRTQKNYWLPIAIVAAAAYFFFK